MTGRLLHTGSYGFLDLQIEDRLETASTVVSAEVIDNFSGLTGDRFDIHMSDRAARELGFSARVAHGLLVLSLIDGLKNQSTVTLRAVASLGWDISFRAPVLAGESLRATFEVRDIRPTSDARRGIVVFEVNAFNQRDKVIQAGRNTLMMLP